MRKMDRVLEDYGKDTPCEIFPFLFLGNFAYGFHDPFIEKYRWDHIISLCGDDTLETRKGAQFPPCVKSYTHLPVLDCGSADIRRYFDRAIDIIQKAKASEERVYIHCVLGVSRSSTIVLAYLMKCHEMSFDDALRFLKGKRKQVSPNFGFRLQLLEWIKVGES